jgi:hypothetical protein
VAAFEKRGLGFLKDLAWWGKILWAHKPTGFTLTHQGVVGKDDLAILG